MCARPFLVRSAGKLDLTLRLVYLRPCQIPDLLPALACEDQQPTMRP